MHRNLCGPIGTMHRLCAVRRAIIVACPASSSSGAGGMRRRCAASIAALLLAGGTPAVSASDSALRLVAGDGVVHLTNVPADPR